MIEKIILLPLVVGLAAGVSTCMALVGSLVLGVSAKYAEAHPDATKMQKFRPHIYFNIGRIVSYAILGGIIALIGKAIAPSGSFLGALMIIVGLVMLILGINLIGIFPKLQRFGLYMPKSVARFFGADKKIKEYSHIGSMVSGALTFFLPCGFTQAMQVYAITSGSFLNGALIMAMFALGTAPGLLGIGGLASLTKGKWSNYFFKIVGVVVVVVAIVNINSGLNLAGVSVSDFVKVSDNSAKVEIVNGVQVIKMKQLPNGYSPREFTVKAGVSVRWEIESESQYTCAAFLILPDMRISKALQAGKNIIEFTPTKIGRMRFSCSMGMYTGVINVIN